jgi:hypothetical protein
MPPRWNEYRKVIARNGFELVRSKKHETWVRRDEEGRVAGQTRASHGNAEIADSGLFRELLRQCGKTEEHFFAILKARGTGRRR